MTVITSEWDNIREKMFDAAEILVKRPLSLEEKYSLLDSYNRSMSPVPVKKASFAVRKVFHYLSCFHQPLSIGLPSLDVISQAIRELDGILKDA